MAGCYHGIVFQGDEPEYSCVAPRSQGGDRSLGGNLGNPDGCYTSSAHAHGVER